MIVIRFIENIFHALRTAIFDFLSFNKSVNPQWQPHQNTCGKILMFHSVRFLYMVFKAWQTLFSQL